jgi:hypothetical protein
MRWKKLGQIFNTSEHVLPLGCLEFAQSPQALVLDDRVRVYFSTRVREGGKFLSHIAFVDFDKSMHRILQLSSKPVIELGKQGCFDEHGIFPFHVVRNANQIYAFTCGWSRRVSVSVETSIGIVTSCDEGVSFKRQGDGPILTSSLYEPFLVGDPFVIVEGGIWHMWYIYGSQWIPSPPPEPSPARVYKIAYATSPNGYEWKKHGRQLIPDHLNLDECQALPTVIKIGQLYHMYFCYREATDFRKNKTRGYRLGYAFSEDLMKWTRDEVNVGITFSNEGWDSEMLCYPHLFQCDQDVYMLYNGNEFGRLGFGLAQLEK